MMCQVRIAPVACRFNQNQLLSFFLECRPSSVVCLAALMDALCVRIQEIVSRSMCLSYSAVRKRNPCGRCFAKFDDYYQDQPVYCFIIKMDADTYRHIFSQNEVMAEVLHVWTKILTLCFTLTLHTTNHKALFVTALPISSRFEQNLGSFVWYVFNLWPDEIYSLEHSRNPWNMAYQNAEKKVSQPHVVSWNLVIVWLGTKLKFPCYRFIKERLKRFGYVSLCADYLV